MDIKSNIAIFNHTFAVDVVPICKDDIMCLPQVTAKRLGNISQIVLCMQVGCAIRLIDPRTTQICELSSMAYWKSEFRALANARQLVEFIVLDVQPVDEVETLDALPVTAAPVETQTSGKKRRRAAIRQSASAHRMRSNKHQLCDVHVARASDLGHNDTTYITRSHLGYILKPGDSALG
jgi:nonsense-mediated mRNA decay protein 3